MLFHLQFTLISLCNLGSYYGLYHHKDNLMTIYCHRNFVGQTCDFFPFGKCKAVKFLKTIDSCFSDSILLGLGVILLS